jgi:hypothetical protein
MKLNMCFANLGHVIVSKVMQSRLKSLGNMKCLMSVIIPYWVQ